MNRYTSLKTTLEKEFDKIVNRDRRNNRFDYARLQRIVRNGMDNWTIPHCLGISIDLAVQSVEAALKREKLFDRLVDRKQPGGGCYDEMFNYAVLTVKDGYDKPKLEFNRSDATTYSSGTLVNPRLWEIPRDGFLFQVSGRPFKRIPPELAKLDKDILLPFGDFRDGSQKYDYLIFRANNRLIFGGRTTVPGYVLSNWINHVIDVRNPQSNIPVTSYYYHGSTCGSSEGFARNLFNSGYWVKGVLDTMMDGVLTWVDPSVKLSNAKAKKDTKAILIARNIASIYAGRP